MEETTKSPNQNKKFLVKFSAGGGGIGAVVLLGGALLTAAIASAFAVRRKRRSSALDEINQKTDNSKGEEIELEDESFKLDDKETGAEIDDHGFVIVNEEISLLALKSDHLSKEGQNINLAEREGVDDEMDARSSEEDAEVKEMQPIQDENNAVEAEQINEFEGFNNGDGEINEEKCVEKTILPLFESHAIQQDNLVEEAPLPTDKDQHKAEEAKHNPLDMKFFGELQETNIQVTKDEENGCTKSSWEALWQTESAKESSMVDQLMKYEVRGKTEEDRVLDNGLLKNGEASDSSSRRLMIWVICVISSFSCSWFIDLSFPKLCLFMFFTLFLSEIYGYSVPNRRQHGYVLKKEALLKNKIIKGNAKGVKNM